MQVLTSTAGAAVRVIVDMGGLGDRKSLKYNEPVIASDRKLDEFFSMLFSILILAR